MRRLRSLAPLLPLVAACSAAAPSTVPSPPGSGAASPASSGSPSSAAASPEVRSVDVGGRSLYLECRGEGSPVVVLEAGLTGDHRTWERIAPAVAAETRVCAYDRANIAPSDPAATPRTAQDVVEDLAALLDAAGEPGPYVLVGFSFGGLTTQVFAAEHPDDVAGLVLVESNHPDEHERISAQLTPEQVAEEEAFMGDNPEGIDLVASFEEAQAIDPLPAVPLVVVTAGLSEGWPEAWGDPATFDRLRAEDQASLVDLVPDGVQVIAERSTHHIPSQQPEVVVEAILDVVGRAP